MKKLRIGTQLAAVFAVPIVTVAAIAAFLWHQFGAIEQARQTTAAMVELQMAAHDVVLQEYLHRFGTRGAVLTLKPKQLQMMADSRKLMEIDFSALAADGMSVPEIPELVAEALPISRRMNDRDDVMVANAARDRQSALDGYFGLSKAPKAMEAKTILASNSADSLVLDADSQRIAQAADAAGFRAETVAAKGLAIARVTLMVALGLVIAITSVLAFAFGRRLTRRLNAVTVALHNVVREDFAALAASCKHVAAGDLHDAFVSRHEAMPVEGHDEIADLAISHNALTDGLRAIAREFDAMLETLDGVIAGVTRAAGQLVGVSDHVALGSGESRTAVDHISTAIDNVARGARQQAGGISDAKSAVEELSRAAGQIAGGAADQTRSAASAAHAVAELDAAIVALAGYGRSLAESAQNASKQATLGTNAVSQTAAALAHLRDASAKVTEAMGTLENRSTEVADIVSVIDEIADQTNLLALNAAIEAARAGEHGRGFAVVADEVRKLAERSTASTHKIADILGAIRKETISAADAMRASEGIMARGIALATDATSALTSVSAAIDDTARVAEDVAGRTTGMQTASSTLTGEMSSVSAIVDTNATAAHHMQATTERVLATIVPIAATALTQAETADAVSAATAELAAQVQQMDSTASDLRAQAGALTGLVATFGDAGKSAAPLASGREIPAPRALATR